MNLVFAKSGLFVRKSQKGFTLLELLVVITLLAILSVGALVAYEGIGDTAQATAASNNTARADQAIRNFKAVTQSYPDQWDNLVAASGTDENAVAVAATEPGVAPAFMNNEARGWLSALAFNGSTVEAAVVTAFDNVGIEEIQTRTRFASTVGVEPNLQHNEGAAAGVGVAELTLNNLSHIAVVPSGTLTCEVGGVAVAAFLDTLDEDGVLTGTPAPVTVAAGRKLNKINDAIESDECQLVVALGFGHDAAHSTNGSSVAISTAPTYVGQNINPNTDYARYVALFHVGADENGDDDVTVGEIFNKARLIAVVDTEGNMIDENIAASTDESAN